MQCTLLLLLLIWPYSALSEVKCKIIDISECQLAEKTVIASDNDFTIRVSNANITKLNVLPSNRWKIIPQSIFNIYPRLEHLIGNSLGVATIAADRFVNATHLRELHLRNNTILALPAKLFANASKLEWIDLSENCINSLAPFAFEHLASLHTLNLSCNAIKSISPNIFNGLKSIRVLALNENRIGTVDVASFNASSLEELYLQQNALSELPNGTFTKLTQLKELHLEGNRLRRIDGVLEQCPLLHTLALGNNPSLALRLQAFAQHPTLSYLSLENTAIVVDTKANRTLVSNSSIVYLNLSSNNLSNPNIFESLQMFGKLEEVQLVNNNFTQLNHTDKLHKWFPALNYLLIIDNRHICKWFKKHVADFRKMKIKLIINYDETDEKCKE